MAKRLSKITKQKKKNKKKQQKKNKQKKQQQQQQKTTTTNHQDIYAKTYNDRKIVNHSRSTALERSVKVLIGPKSILRDHNPRPYFCRGIHKTFVQSA